MTDAQMNVLVNPAALVGAQLLVTSRIEDLDALAADLEAQVIGAGEQRSYVIARLADLRTGRETLLSVSRALSDLVALATPVDAGPTRLRSASRQVFQIIEAERMRIARDMHDGPAQSMSNLVLQAEILERLIARDPQMVVKELADFKNDVRAVLDDIRRLIFDLRPMTLDDLGLVPTMCKLITEFDNRPTMAASLRVTGDAVRLSGNYEQTLFRIIQEALNNAKKHAQARNVEVVIDFGANAVIATVRDDGVGFDVANTEERLDTTNHLGLISMRERASLEKGSLSIQSTAGRGTEVRVAFDLVRS